MALQPVILAGGTGTRLWPLSRELYPKQVIQLLGEHSLLQNTLLRVAKLPEAKAPLLVIGEQHRFMIQNQMRELNLGTNWRLLLEPLARDTAAAVCGAACFHAAQDDPEDVLLVLPADHLITNQGAFVAAVAEAMHRAQGGAIVTFGLMPSRPETGFGYIAATPQGQVERFVEKPDLATAENYVKNGYLWNSGMFAFRADSFLAEMRAHAPEIKAAMQQAVAKGAKDGEQVFTFAAMGMEPSPSISIDHALMEKTSRAEVVRCDLGWSDIGSWRTLWEVLPKDENGNVVSGDTMLTGVKNSLIRADHSLLAAIGLENMLVVQSADAVLVAPLDQSQAVKKVVAQLRAAQRKEYVSHRQVFRPWGSYTILEERPRFRIKRLSVDPGARLSLQRHAHRHEHWVVASGVATVQNGEEVFILHEDESTHIPAGALHRLGNKEKESLEIIEVQIGTYLGEDDIERFADEYGRPTGMME